MSWIDVQSSNICAYRTLRGKINDTVDLYLRFKSGDVYCYENVKKSVFELFLAAPSKGEFLNKDIKKWHPFRKVTDEDVDSAVKAESSSRKYSLAELLKGPSYGF